MALTLAQLETRTQRLLQDDGTRFPGGAGFLRDCVNDAIQDFQRETGCLKERLALSAVGLATAIYAASVEVLAVHSVERQGWAPLEFLPPEALAYYDSSFYTTTGSAPTYYAMPETVQTSGAWTIRLLPDPGTQLTDVLALLTYVAAPLSGNSDTPKVPPALHTAIPFGAAARVAESIGEFAELREALWLPNWQRAIAQGQGLAFMQGTTAPRVITPRWF